MIRCLSLIVQIVSFFLWLPQLKFLLKPDNHLEIIITSLHFIYSFFFKNNTYLHGKLDDILFIINCILFFMTTTTTQILLKLDN